MSEHVSKQQLKLARQAQDRQVSPPPGRMVRTPKPRPRAGFEDQKPMDGPRRLTAYEKQNGTLSTTHRLTPKQRRRYFKKVHANNPLFKAAVKLVAESGLVRDRERAKALAL